MKTKLLFLFTRTPMHIGAGAALGAVDQPLPRERHTQFPFIPGSTIKGAFVHRWTDPDGQRTPEGQWLFGMGESGAHSAGALHFSEGRLLAFPLRSARGSFAWITCPLILRRWVRDGGLPATLVPQANLRDDQALFARNGPLTLGDKIVLEEYALSHAGELAPAISTPADSAGASGARSLTDQFRLLLKSDAVGSQMASRLVMVSDGMMSFFVQSSCEIAQRIFLDDSRGAAQPNSFFSQENIPSETLFYVALNIFEDRPGLRPPGLNQPAEEVFRKGLQGQACQFGADASIGLGLCSVELGA